MAKSLLVTSRGNVGATQGVTTAGSTQYWWLGQAALPGNTVESNREIPWRTAGVISKLYVKVLANVTSAQSTLTVRKNGADTGLTVTIPAGAGGIGVFEDTTNTVTIAAGDKTCYKTVTGAGGAFAMSIVSVIFDATTNCVTKLIPYPVAVTTASATHYMPVSGVRSGTTTGEANVENTIKIAGTAKNAYIIVASNARVNDTVFTLRKNRADTAIVFTYTSGETGIKEDTSNSISYAVNDEIDWKIVSGSGTQNLTWGCAGLEYETTGSSFITNGSSGASADITIGPGVTEYYAVGGAAMEGQTTEADTQLKVREGFTLSNFTVYARANTLTATSTFKLRINGADATQVCSIGSGVTGFVVDTTHTDTVVPGDLIDVQCVSGGTGTTLTVGQIALWTTLTRVANPVIIEYNITARVLNSLILKYNLVGRVVQNVILKYHIAQRIVNNIILKYNLVGRVLQSLISKYNIVGRVTQPVILKYNIIQHVIQNLILKYHIAEHITNAVDLKYHLRERILNSVIVEYDIVGRITNNVIVSYNLVGRVARGLVIRYNLRERIANSTIFKYNLRERITNNVISKYNITGRVANELDVVYNIVGRTTKNLITRYHVQGRVTSSLDVKYNITERIIQSLIIAYDIAEAQYTRVVNQLDLAYNIFVRTQNQMTLRYKIVGRVVEVLAIKFNQRGRMPRNPDLKQAFSRFPAKTIRDMFRL